MCLGTVSCNISYYRKLSLHFVSHSLTHRFPVASSSKFLDLVRLRRRRPPSERDLIRKRRLAFHPTSASFSFPMNTRAVIKLFKSILIFSYLLLEAKEVLKLSKAATLCLSKARMECYDVYLNIKIRNIMKRCSYLCMNVKAKANEISQAETLLRTRSIPYDMVACLASFCFVVEW